MSKSICTCDTYIKSGYLTVFVDALEYDEYNILNLYYKNVFVGGIIRTVGKLKLDGITEDPREKGKKIKYYEVVKSH